MCVSGEGGNGECVCVCGGGKLTRLRHGKIGLAESCDRVLLSMHCVVCVHVWSRVCVCLFVLQQISVEIQ